MNTKTTRTGGQVLVDQLLRQGVRRLSCVPGESYLPVLDALHDTGIDVLVCRHEGGAALMAEAHGKLTGRPGICFVTRGPGATNACHGLHVAAHDSTPMILFVGQVETGFRHREAFQELDYRASFGAIAKWVCEIDDARRLPELLARAFRVAMQGRPGPVVIALPEDMLQSAVDVEDAPRIEPAETAPDPAAMQSLRSLLESASRPLLIAGGSRWSATAAEGLRTFARQWQLPVATSFRRAGLFPSTDPLYAGEFAIATPQSLRRQADAADLILLVGGRMSEVPSDNYSLIELSRASEILVHVHPDAGELGRVYQPRLAIHATPACWVAEALAMDGPGQLRDPATVHSVHNGYLEWMTQLPQNPGRFQYGAALRWLRDRLPDDAIVCNGAGNYSQWLQRYLPIRAYGTQLAATSGSMGYGLPAAIIAKREHPDRVVVAFAGDGCFLMTGQEFATAVQFEIPVVVIVIDNGMYGTIRMHQERHFPARPFATALRNPDFAALARACGGHGERVASTEEFAPAFERAIASGRPAILHCLLDPEAITPSTTLSALRDQAVRQATV